MSTTRTASLALSDGSTGFIPKRGRPTADQATAISKTIISAAAEIFLAEGYEGASMEAIAVRAGVPKSTLYKRYADKQAVLRAVLRERLSAWTVADPEEALSEDLASRLERHASGMLVRASSGEVRAFLGLVASAWCGPDEAASRQEVIGYTAMLDRLVRDIRELGPKQGVHAKDPRRAARALMAMLAGWIELGGGGGDVAQAEAAQFAHDAVELLMRGSSAW